jgi:hypothetical protein
MSGLPSISKHVAIMTNLTSGKWILLVWFCFLVRGVFYCTVLPLWDGFDEWAHFAVAQAISSTGRLVIDRNTVSRSQAQFYPLCKPRSEEGHLRGTIFGVHKLLLPQKPQT